MTHHARSFSIAFAAAIAFFVGAGSGAVAGDPDESPEAEAPAEIPAVAIWNTEVRSAEIDGLRVSLEDGQLAIAHSLRDTDKTFDFDVRCEVAQGSPMARMYIPPHLVSEKRVEGRLATGQRMTIPLELTAHAENGEDQLGMYDTLRLTIRPHGGRLDVAPLATLQVPRT